MKKLPRLAHFQIRFSLPVNSRHRPTSVRSFLPRFTWNGSRASLSGWHMAWLSGGDGWQGPPTSQDPWVWVRNVHLPLPSHPALLHRSLGCWQLLSFCFSFIPQILGLLFECKGSAWVSQVKSKQEEPTLSLCGSLSPSLQSEPSCASSSSSLPPLAR